MSCSRPASTAAMISACPIASMSIMGWLTAGLVSHILTCRMSCRQKESQTHRKQRYNAFDSENSKYLAPRQVVGCYYPPQLSKTEQIIAAAGATLFLCARNGVRNDPQVDYCDEQIWIKDLSENIHASSKGAPMQSSTKCAHPACNCVPADGTKHCSTACADAKGMSQLTCQCQHQDCQRKGLKA